MKKLLASLLAGAMALSLVACGGGSSSAPGSASGAEPASSGGNTSQADSSGDGELRTVKMCLARSAEVLEDTPFWVAENLGYMAEEGLKLEMIETFGTTDCKMVATGQADFAVPGPSLALQSIEQGLPIKVVCAYDAINIWGLCVPTDSPYQTFEDMQDAVSKYGRKLTVALGDASWESLVTPTLVAAGIDPAEDLEFVVAGDQRYVQVAEGTLDILFTWPGEAYQLMGQGYDFKYIDGNEVLKTCSGGIITSLDMIENEPEVIEGFVRALCKGIYFTKYNPEAAAAVSCDQWPNIDVTWETAVARAGRPQLSDVRPRGRRRGAEAAGEYRYLLGGQVEAERGLHAGNWHHLHRHPRGRHLHQRICGLDLGPLSGRGRCRRLRLAGHCRPLRGRLSRNIRQDGASENSGVLTRPRCFSKQDTRSRKEDIQ